MATIQKIDVAQITVPLKRPFVTALRRRDAVESLLVRVTDSEGRTGHGEAPPTPPITGETMDSIKTAVLGHIAPAVTGLGVEELDGVMAALHGCMHGNTSAKAAVDMALYDLLAQRCGLPLYQLLGGRRGVLQTDLTISLGAPAQMAEDSRDALAGGYTILKVKVGANDGLDVARMTAVRAAVGPEVTLRIDANQGWTAKDAVRAVRACEDAGVAAELVEQPVPAWDFDGLRYVTANVATPVLADESVFSLQDAARIIQTHAADYLNLKLMKTGGIYNALGICALAEAHGVQCMMGCMLETRLAVSAAAHVAAAKGAVTRVDLDGPALCAQDPYTGGPAFSGETITLSGAPGIGITGVPGFAQ